ncbi:MAG: RNA polymerase sigma factor [Nitrospinota bacterium]
MDWQGKILARFRRGEVEAFDEIVLRYQDRVYNLIYRMSWDENEARDLVQETFLQAFRSFGNFRGESNVGTWLHRIAVNIFLKLKRQSRPEFFEPLPVEELELAGKEFPTLRSPTPEEALEEKEGRTLLEKAIGKLPEEYRAILVLRDLEGRSAAEVAEILGLSVQAAKSRLHRARVFVRRELQRSATFGAESGGLKWGLRERRRKDIQSRLEPDAAPVFISSRNELNPLSLIRT